MKIYPEKFYKDHVLIPYGLAWIMYLAILLPGTSAQGQQFYPEKYFEEAVEKNPGLQASLKSLQAVQQQIVSGSSLPDPQLNIGLFTPPMERLMGNQVFSVELMQMFPWFGLRGLQRSAGELMADASWQQYRMQRNEVFMQMTMLWLEMIQNRNQQQINRKYIGLLRNREDLLYTRLSAGGTGITADIYRIEIRLAELENEIRKMDDEFETMLHSFNRLAGRGNDLMPELPDSLPPFPGEWVCWDEPEESPGYRMLLLEAGAAAIMRDAARLETRPMFGLGLQYSWFSPGNAAMGQMDGGHMIMPMISASLPLFARKNRAIRLQAQLNAEAAEFRAQESLNNLQIQWQQLQSKARTLTLDEDFYRRQLQVTHRIHEIILSGYSAGEDRFDELLEVEDQLLQLEERLLQSLINRYINHAELEMLAGKGVFE
jgi:outer membrane protein, heavy metal efflux system